VSCSGALEANQLDRGYFVAGFSDFVIHECPHKSFRSNGAASNSESVALEVERWREERSYFVRGVRRIRRQQQP
jgi:hypothetical protein